MPKLPVVKTKELIRALKKLDFFEHHRVGSHAQFKHLDGRRTTIPVHYGKILTMVLCEVLLEILI